METVNFEQVVSRGCGFDVHKEMVVATIDGEGLKRSTREFGTFTRSLTELKEWLLENGVTHVAMESTGVYWKPVYHVLEPSGIQVWIVNARHVKNIRVTKQIRKTVPGCVNFFWRGFSNRVTFLSRDKGSFVT